MPSSLYTRIKLRLLDALLARLHRPNRVDGAATVAEGVEMVASSIHGPVRIGRNARLFNVEVSGPVTIGDHSSLWGPGIHVLAHGDPIEIGSYCSIARYVSVHGYLHDPGRLSTHFIGRNVLGRPIEEEVWSKGPTRIGHDVWIGAGAHVISGVSIGNGSIIGAGSVVSRDVPPFGIAVGAPARVVRMRFDDAIIERIQASAWWSWSPEEIRAKEGLFTGAVTPELLDEFLEAEGS